MTFSTDQTQQLSCYIEDAIVSHNRNIEILSALNLTLGEIQYFTALNERKVTS